MAKSARDRAREYQARQRESGRRRILIWVTEAQEAAILQRK